MSINKEKLQLGIIGAGRVGSNLAFWLSRKGWHIKAIFSRSKNSAQNVAFTIPTGVARDLPFVCKTCDVIFITVNDSAIIPVVEEIGESKKIRAKTLIHCSGALPSSILGVAGLEIAKLSIHPFASIPTLCTTRNPFAGVFFGIEGDSMQLAKMFVEDLGGYSMYVDPAKKVLYHASGAIAANFIGVLALAAKNLLIETGIPEETADMAVKRMIETASMNIISDKMENGITGPIVRGDVQTVSMHIDALRGTPYLSLYIELSRKLAEIIGDEESFENLFSERPASMPKKKSPYRNRGSK